MKSHRAARMTLARLTRELYRDEIDIDKYRALVYGFSVILNFFKLELDSDLMGMLEEVRDSEQVKRARP